VVHTFRLLMTLVLSLSSAAVLAVGAEWQRFVIPSTGTSVEIPVTIFSRATELPDGGIGRRFYTDDSRADLTVQSVANPNNDPPATFLAKKNPPSGILYKRVTARFFVVSSIRNDRIWYNRCCTELFVKCIRVMSGYGMAAVGAKRTFDCSRQSRPNCGSGRDQT
jgi:hypothetical protein